MVTTWLGYNKTTLVHNNAWLDQARASNGCYMFVTKAFGRNKVFTSQAWPNKNKPWLGISNTWPNLAKYNKARLLQPNQASQATTHYF